MNKVTASASTYRMIETEATVNRSVLAYLCLVDVVEMDQCPIIFNTYKLRIYLNYGPRLFCSYLFHGYWGI